MTRDWQAGPYEKATWPPGPEHPALQILYEECDNAGLIALHGPPQVETVEQFLLRLAHTLLTPEEKKVMG